jgi:hypothetical protein
MDKSREPHPLRDKKTIEPRRPLVPETPEKQLAPATGVARANALIDDCRRGVGKAAIDQLR